MLVIAALWATAWSSQTEGAVPLTPLGKFLTSHGYGGAQLVHPGNAFRLPINSNGKAGDLTIDTGAPCSLVFRGGLRKLGLTEVASQDKVRGAFGAGRDMLGHTIIGSFTMGNCTFQNLPVAVASDYEGMGIFRRYGSSDGLLGLREMFKFGAVLDLGNRLLFVRPSGPSRDVAATIRSILNAQGYTPIQLNVVKSHLRIPATVNGFACNLIVDTGAYVTAIDRYTASKAKIGGIRTQAIARGLGDSSREVSVATFPTFRLGPYEIKNASAVVVGLNTELLGAGTGLEAGGLVGAEYLSMNSAVFDFNSNTLYLKPKPKT